MIAPWCVVSILACCQAQLNKVTLASWGWPWKHHWQEGIMALSVLQMVTSWLYGSQLSPHMCTATLHGALPHLQHLTHYEMSCMLYCSAYRWGLQQRNGLLLLRPRHTWRKAVKQVKNSRRSSSTAAMTGCSINSCKACIPLSLTSSQHMTPAVL